MLLVSQTFSSHAGSGVFRTGQMKADVFFGKRGADASVVVHEVEVICCVTPGLTGAFWCHFLCDSFVIILCKRTHGVECAGLT